MSIERGDIVLVNLEPVMGSEQGKTRPCVVVQNDIGNRTSPTTIVAPLSSQTEKTFPFTVLVPRREANLSRDSLVLCNQIRTVSIKDRIIKRVGSLKSSTMKKVDDALKTSLGMD